ncbi:MAG: DNA polymerase III subunit gamma/tau, partial [Candidatus Magasanikbacteria bacterium CG10_big_fil_rev_8_21_14_0_10_43_6]
MANFLYTTRTINSKDFVYMALYHTHRPQDFGSVVGQEHIVKTLSNQILAGTVAHAYLFFGPRGIGKTTTARLLAKSMNCTERKKDSAEPCNACASCLEIGRGSALDVIEIDAASHTGVDNVRENIIDNAQFRPTKSAYKVFIIDEVHMLSTSAFNALLKTLEEPPQHVLFILATTELHKLPDTIVSRCQRFTFSKIPSDALKAHLAHIASSLGVTCEESVLNHIVQKSEGCARDAISLLEQVMATGEKHITAASAAFLLPPSAAEEVVALTTAIVHGETHTALQTIQHLYDQGFQFLQFTDDCIAFLRTLLIAQVTPQYIDTLALEAATKKSITELSSSLTQKKLIALIEAFFDARAQLRQTPMPQLPLEILAVAQTQTDPMSASPVSTPLPPGAALPTQKAIPATPPPATDTVQMEENTPLPASEEPKKQSLAKKVKA